MATGNLNVASINDSQLGGFRNLIINGNFQVNQRGHYSITEETSGTPATGYHYDRWYYDGTTYLYQGVEDKNVFNGTYTLSWQDAGSDITASYVVSTDTTAGDGPDSGLTWTSVSNGGTITINEGTEFSKHLWVRFDGTLTNLSKVQLEVGSTATAFEHRPYGVELALCQRYCVAFKPISNGAPIGIGQAYSATTAIISITPPVTMRANPTAIRNGLSIWSDSAASDLAVSSLSVFLSSWLSFLRLNVTVASGLTVGQAAFLQGTSTPAGSGYLILDSEL